MARFQFFAGDRLTDGQNRLLNPASRMRTRGNNALGTRQTRARRSAPTAKSTCSRPAKGKERGRRALSRTYRHRREYRLRPNGWQQTAVKSFKQ